MARIVGNLAQPINQSSIASIALTLTDLTLGVILLSAFPISVLSAISNGLVQSDPRWQKDSPSFLGPDGLWGYNFLFTLPAANFVNSGDTYQIDVAFTPNIGEQWRIVYQIKTVPVYG